MAIRRLRGAGRGRLNVDLMERAAGRPGRGVAAPWAGAVMLVLVLGLGSGCRQGFDVARVDDSVVRIEHIAEATLVYKAAGKPRRRLDVLISLLHGSGFVLDAEGRVATNNHVVAFCRRPDDPRTCPAQPGRTRTFRTPRGKGTLILKRYLGMFVPDGGWGRDRWRPVRVLWQSPKLDMAVIEAEGLHRPPVVLSAADPGAAPEKSDPVYAYGFPGAGDAFRGEQVPLLEEGDLEPSLTTGSVSKVDRSARAIESHGRPIIQHTAALGGGNSGGPLFNACNEVIGINTFVKADKRALESASYSPHVSALVQALRTDPALRGIRVRTRSSPCRPGLGLSARTYVLGGVGLASLALIGFAALRWRAARRGPRRPGSASTPPARASGRERHGPAEGRRPPPAAERMTDLAAGPGWVLTGVDGKGDPVSIRIPHEVLRAAGEAGVVLGRHEALAHVVLADPSVSRRHARLVAVADGLGIVDLNSAEGTVVDGQRLKPYAPPRPLAPGARVTLGRVSLRVLAP